MKIRRGCGGRENGTWRLPNAGSIINQGPLLLDCEICYYIFPKALLPMSCWQLVADRPFPEGHGIPVIATFGLRTPQWPCQTFLKLSRMLPPNLSSLFLSFRLRLASWSDDPPNLLQLPSHFLSHGYLHWQNPRKFYPILVSASPRTWLTEIKWLSKGYTDIKRQNRGSPI